MVDSIIQIKELKINIDEIDDILMQLKSYKERMGTAYLGIEYNAMNDAVDNISRKLNNIKEELRGISGDIEITTKEISDRKEEEAREEAERQRQAEEEIDKEKKAKEEKEELYSNIKREKNKKSKENSNGEVSKGDKKIVNNFFSLR